MNEPAHRAHRRPFWLAALVTCIAVPTAFALFMLVTSAISGGMAGVKRVSELLLLPFLIGVPVSAIAMFLFAMPVLMLFRERRLLGVLTVCALTIFVGALILPVAMTLFSRGDFIWVLMPWGAGCGALAGLVFCLTAGVPWRPKPA